MSPLSEPITPKQSLATIPQFTKEHIDLWMSRVRNDYNLLLNVDYRTIDYKWAQDVDEYRVDNDDLNYLKEYVDWVKKNHIKIEGYFDPEPSTICLMRDYTVRGRYKIKIDSYDTYKNLFYDDSWVNLPHLEKGVWYEGDADVELITNQFGDFGDTLKVSNMAWLWEQMGSTKFYTIKKSN